MASSFVEIKRLLGRPLATRHKLYRDPVQKHLKVDQHLKHTKSKEHFDRWLELWSETLDSLFQGELAEQAKIAAQRMGQAQLAVVQHHRPQS